MRKLLILLFFFFFISLFFPLTHKTFAACADINGGKCIGIKGLCSTFGLIDSAESCPQGITPSKCCVKDVTGGGTGTGGKNPYYSKTAPPPPCAPGGLSGVTCTLVNSAIGAIPTNISGFVRILFAVVLSLSGGIAVILIIISGYKLIASQGNPEGVKGAQEQLTAAIVGLLFIIFSFVIIQFIGVDVLGIFTP